MRTDEAQSVSTPPQTAYDISAKPLPITRVFHTNVGMFLKVYCRHSRQKQIRLQLGMYCGASLVGMAKALVCLLCRAEGNTISKTWNALRLRVICLVKARGLKFQTTPSSCHSTPAWNEMPPCFQSTVEDADTYWDGHEQSL